MNKEICIIHANCQGEPLMERLKLCPAFAERYECFLFTNYIREPVPHVLLNRASLFLYQWLGAKWDELSSDVLLKQLPSTATSLCIPNMVFPGYWPFWSGKPGFDYRDTRLDTLMEMALSPEEVLTLYLAQPLSRYVNLDVRLAEILEIETRRENQTPIKYLDHIRRHWRERRLFNTVNHPGPELLNRAAADILTYLGLTGFEDLDMESLGDPYPEFEQPIHPRVARHFGLPFADATTEYEVYGCKMHFASYVAHYIDCRRHGIKDFVGYLVARSQEQREKTTKVVLS